MTERVDAMPDVRLTVAVDDEVKKLKPALAEQVWSAIGRIGYDEGEPFALPGAPPGTQYLALTPPGRQAPVVVYRPMRPDEDGDWLVTSLVARDKYEAWRKAVQAALDNPVLTATAAGAIAALIRSLWDRERG